MSDVVPSCRYHRCSVEAISHCVWLYFRFPLSLREVAELMLERGIVVSYETVQRWCLKFGQVYANAGMLGALSARWWMPRLSLRGVLVGSTAVWPAAARHGTG